MSRTAVVALTLAALSLSQQPAAPDFGQRFRTAAQEPGQIVPLILAQMALTVGVLLRVAG